MGNVLLFVVKVEEICLLEGFNIKDVQCVKFFQFAPVKILNHYVNGSRLSFQGTTEV